MTGPLQQLTRRLRFGTPIVVVSGLPRSGTSMTMKMLEAGGLPIVTDGKRTADESNPKGYYEFEPVERLGQDTDTSWLDAARGKVIKVVSPLLPHLPEDRNYRVVFMRRNLDEILASQSKMLVTRGEDPDATSDADLLAFYEDHLRKVTNLLDRRPCFEWLEVQYAEVLGQPEPQAERLRAFVGHGLDVRRMAEVVDPDLYRNRR